MQEPKIDIRIPYEPGGQLGVDYNRIMSESKQDWVLLIDHDIIVSLHPHWYYVCQQVILKYPDAGLFTCYASDIACSLQKCLDSPPNTAPVHIHREFAKKLWKKNKYECELIKPSPALISGFFLLVNRKAWETVGGFLGKGMYREDNYFHKELNKHNIKVYLIKGLYCYHYRDRSKEEWINGADFNTKFISRDKQNIKLK
jgi:GT2 family glycosyltransferase